MRQRQRALTNDTRNARIPPPTQVYYVFSLTAILATITGEKGQEMVRKVRTIVIIFLILAIALITGIVINVMMVDTVR